MEFNWVSLVITALLAVVGYFLVKWMNAVDKLIEAVGKLGLVVEKIQANQNNTATNCALKHEVIDKRLNAHSERLNKHDIAITELKVGLKDLKEDI